MSPTTSTTPIARDNVWPPAGWLLKKEAAKILDRSEERVAALSQKEGLEATQAKPLKSIKRENPETKQIVTLIHQGDVEAERWRRKNPQEVVDPLGGVANPDNPDTPLLSAGKPQLALPAAEPEAAEEEAAEASDAPPASPWPWLNLEQAVKYGKRPERWLKAQTKLPKDQRSIVICDVGPGPGGQFMFHRESLEKA